MTFDARKEAHELLGYSSLCRFGTPDGLHVAACQQTTAALQRAFAAGQASRPDGGGAQRCLCVRPAAPCVGPCSTVERWAAACRAAHWHEDDTLKSWAEFVAVNVPPERDTSEPDLWRSVARAAITALANSGAAPTHGVVGDVLGTLERVRSRCAGLATTIRKEREALLARIKAASRTAEKPTDVLNLLTRIVARWNEEYHCCDRSRRGFTAHNPDCVLAEANKFIEASAT